MIASTNFPKECSQEHLFGIKVEGIANNERLQKVWGLSRVGLRFMKLWFEIYLGLVRDFGMV